jgi:hypothetical protein
VSKPVIPEGRTTAPNVAALRRSRLTKAPDQDFVVQVATRDSAALGLDRDPQAPYEKVQFQTPAPAGAPETAHQQQPSVAPAAGMPPAQAQPLPQQPVAQQAPAASFWQPHTTPQPFVVPAVQPATDHIAQQRVPEQPQKRKADEAPRKKKENYLQDPEDAARVRRAFNRTKHITMIENWSEFVCNALMEKTAQLEQQYNGGQPFEGPTKAPMGRPASAE